MSHPSSLVLTELLHRFAGLLLSGLGFVGAVDDRLELPACLWAAMATKSLNCHFAVVAIGFHVDDSYKSINDHIAGVGCGRILA